MPFAKGHTINNGRTPWNKGMKGLLLNDHFIKHSTKTGSENPNWKGGVSSIGNCPDCGIKLKSYPAKYCLPCSCKHRKLPDNSGENHYRWKGGKPRCLDCNKEITHKAKRCSSCAKLGERNNSWNGGASFHDYPVTFNYILKSEIRERDKYMCVVCGCTEEDNGKYLDVHHIDYNKDNCEPDNLISLCRFCHPRTNYNREKWIEVFKQYV